MFSRIQLSSSRARRFSAASAFFILYTSLSAAESSAESDLFIGARRTVPTSATREWFKPGLKESALYDEAFNAAKMLAYDKLDSAERTAIETAIKREKERCAKAFLWLIDWTKCSDIQARLGAITALEICAPDPKFLGKPLATSATFDPDERVRKASAALIKSRKDVVAQRALLDTWKSSFDDSGVLDANEGRRKAAVDAMRNVGEKQVFQALLYYATLELRAGVAAPVGVDTVNITGAGISLPIDLPSRDLITVEGTIAIQTMASLKQATGQDFGRNLTKWNEWISNLK